MQHYIELTLLPSVEVPLYFLWEKVYQQLHLAFVELNKKNGEVGVGVSFPQYDSKTNHLGSKLRLFSQTPVELEVVGIQNWLSRLTDYVHITSIRSVPNDQADFAIFKRVQTKSSVERLARRKAKREGISIEAALKALADYKERHSNLPYIQIKSLSSDRRYRLMIACTKTGKQSTTKNFNTYGLSHDSSVPMF